MFESKQDEPDAILFRDIQCKKLDISFSISFYQRFQ